MPCAVVYFKLKFGSLILPLTEKIPGCKKYIQNSAGESTAAQIMRVMYRIDIAFDPNRGYAAAILDPLDKKVKGVKASNIRQLCRRIHEAVCKDEQKKRRFPLESEASSVSSIITPGNDPFFNQL